MAVSSVKSPFQQFFDLDGKPLEGKLYIGLPNQDAKQNPIMVYWDAEQQYPAAQPIKVVSGYPSRNGTPALIYVTQSHSMMVENQSGRQVFYARELLDGEIGQLNANTISFTQANSGLARTVQAKLQESITAKDFGAVGNGIADDRGILAIADSNGNFKLTKGTYRISSNITFSNVLTFDAGAILSIDSGATVTFNKQPIADESQHIFMGNGNVAGLKNATLEWFGAVADGVFDCLASFNKVKQSTTHLSLLGGTYYTSGELTVSGSPLVISGLGFRSTKIVWNGNHNVVVFLGASTQGSSITGVQIEKIGAPPSSGAAIFNNGSPDLVIEHVFILRPFIGLQHSGGAAGAQGSVYRDVDIWLFKDCGMLFNGNLVNDVFISDCFLNGEDYASPGTPGSSAFGIRLLDKCEALTFDSVEVILCNYALTTDASSYSFGNRPAYNRFTNCFFDSSTNGVLLDKTVLTEFSGCWFSNRPNSGIIIVQAEALTFTGCDFTNCGQHGALVNSTLAKFITFQGCRFIGNSQTLTNTYHGLAFAAGVSDFVVTGCTLTSGVGFAGQQAYGILVIAGASDRYIIADNLVSGNGTGGVADGGTGINKRVANNY